MDGELRKKLNARKQVVDDHGDHHENKPSRGSCDRAADDNKLKSTANEFVPTGSVAEDSTPKKKSIGERAKEGLGGLGIDTQATQRHDQVVVDASGKSASWEPFMRKPLPHCLTSATFTFAGVEGWTLKLYPLGLKASGEKSQITLIGPAGACSKVGIICGNQMLVPAAFNGELTNDYDVRHMEVSDLKITLQAK